MILYPASFRIVITTGLPFPMTGDYFCTLKNVFLVIWGGGALVFITPFEAPVSMWMHLYLV